MGAHMSNLCVRILRVMAAALGLLDCDQGQAQTPTAPPQASAVGFTSLVFNDEFSVDSFTSAATTRLWWDNFWFFPPAVGTSEMLSGGGIVRLTTPGTSPHTHLINHPVNTSPYGPDYLFGYFEARMRFLPGTGGDVVNSWGAFWLLSKPGIEDNISDANGNKAWCEIDIAEMFGHNLLNTTIHSWYQPSGESPQDTLNPAHLNYVTIDPIDGEWHTFGVLWQSGIVTWYLDNVQVATYEHTFSVCNTQPMTLVLSSQSLTSDSQITDVDWVRIWQ